MKQTAAIILMAMFAFVAFNAAPMVDAQFFGAEAHALAPDPGTSEKSEDGSDPAELGTETAAIGGLANTLQSWMAGDLGLLLVMVGLIVAVIMVVARASLMPVLFVLGLAIVLGWGPAIFAGIFNMQVTAAMLEAAAVEANAAQAAVILEAAESVAELL